MSQKIYSDLEIKGSTTINSISNATTDTDKFIVSDGGLLKYRTGTQMLSDIGVTSGYVPYTGATTNVDLGEFGVSGGYFKLDTTPTSIPTALGTISWDAFYRTASLIDGIGNTNLQVGQEERILVHNNTGVTITDGQVVYINGSTGELPSVALANASTEATSSTTIGVATETIPHGSAGFIITSGVIHNLNTLAFNEGELLWLSTTSGAFTNVAPISPNHLVLIGYVIKKSGGNGSILVKIQNTQELSECSDVLFTALTNNDVMVYESATSLWKNKSISTILGYTPANDTNVVKLTGDQTIAGIKTFTSNILVNGLTVGRGGSNLGTALGEFALFSNTTGNSNTAIGSGAIGNNTSGGWNTGTGAGALDSNSTGNFNTGNGFNSLNRNTTGGYNSAYGVEAGSLIADKTTPATILNNSVMLGYRTSPLADNQTNQTVIGYDATGNGSNTVTIGNSSVTNNYFTGNIRGGAFIKTGGLSTEYLKADGSVSTLTNPITGTGTTNYLPKFTGSNTLGNSPLQTDGTGVSIGLTGGIPSYYLFALERNGASNYLEFRGNGHQGFFASGKGILRFTPSKDIEFFSNFTSLAATIKASGSFLINTSTDNGVDKLQVNGSGYFSSLVQLGDPTTLSSTTKLKINGGIELQTEDGNGGGPNSLLFKNLGGATLSSITGDSDGYLSLYSTNTTYITGGEGTYISGNGWGVLISDNLELNGNTFTLSIPPTPSASTYDILTRNTTTGVVEKVASSTFQTALTNPITGTGTTNYLPKFGVGNTLGNSQVFDNGTNVLIGTTSVLSANYLSQINSSTGGLYISQQSNPSAIPFKIKFLANGVETYWDYGGSMFQNNAINLGTNNPIYFRNTINYVKSTAEYDLEIKAGNAINFSTQSYANTMTVKNSRVLINTPTDDGSNALQITGSVKIATTPSVGNIIRPDNGGAAFQFGNGVNTAYGEFRFKSDGGSDLAVVKNTGNIGIGTTVPTEKLDVVGGRVLSRNGFGVYDQADILNLNSSGGFKFNTGGSVSVIANNGQEYVRFNNGNVGIGTTTPQSKLHLQNDLNTSSENWMINLQNNNPETNTPTAGIRFNVGDSGSSKAGIIFRRTGGYGIGDMYFLNNNTLDASAPTIAANTAMVIKNDGKVGIATSSPLHELSVAGKIGGNIYIGSYLEFLSNGNTKLTANNDVVIGYNQDTIIKQDGKVGIGTTTPGVYKLNVNGHTKITGILDVSSNINTSTIVNSGGYCYTGNGYIISSNEGGIYGSSDELIAVLDYDNNNFYYANGYLKYDQSSFTTTTYGKTYNEKPQVFGTTSQTGEIVKYGTGTTTAGLLYYLNTSAVWTLADADAVASSSGMLGIACGTNPAVNGMLVRGSSRATTTPYTAMTNGQILYVSTTAGEFTATAPTGTGKVVRVIGYCVDATYDTMYFCPDNTWIELT